MIYLDYSATTPVNKEVIDTYSRVCSEFIGNPNSLHKLGVEAKKLIDASTKQIANILAQIAKITSKDSDKEIARVLEDVKNKLNCLV